MKHQKHLSDKPEKFLGGSNFFMVKRKAGITTEDRVEIPYSVSEASGETKFRLSFRLVCPQFRWKPSILWGSAFPIQNIIYAYSTYLCFLSIHDSCPSFYSEWVLYPTHDLMVTLHSTWAVMFSISAHASLWWIRIPSSLILCRTFS